MPWQRPGTFSVYFCMMNVQNRSLFRDGGYFGRPFGATMRCHLEIHLFFLEISLERHLNGVRQVL